MCRRISRHGADGFTPPTPRPEGRRSDDFFIAVKNPSPSAGFETANVGSSGKHAND
jgi:hypothetical protein